jgi:nitrite reductase/ring-hydroxylating ferredoxin subunit
VAAAFTGSVRAERPGVLDSGASDRSFLPKSREEVLMAQFIKVANTADLASGEARCVEVAGKKIALFNLEGSFYAIDDTCTHRGGPLSEGELSGDEVTCPWHGAVYNVKTGTVLGPPAPRGVASYPVRVQGSDVEVEV